MSLGANKKVIAEAGDFVRVEWPDGVQTIECTICAQQHGGGSPATIDLWWGAMTADALPTHVSTCYMPPDKLN